LDGHCAKPRRFQWRIPQAGAASPPGAEFILQSTDFKDDKPPWPKPNGSLNAYFFNSKDGEAVVNKRGIFIASIWLLTLVLPAGAQVQVGDNVNMNLNGTLSTGYTGDFSNYTSSDHGVYVGGNTDLTGFYYTPSFLSFDIQPFYNQSRENSNFQSIFNTSGVGASASIFGGSNFPGTITYSKAYNSEGGFVVPELGNITTRGNNENLGIGWGIHVPDYPSVSFQFMDGNNKNSVFGTNSESTSHSDAFGVNVSHTLAGFHLSGGYNYNKLNAVTPDFLTGQPPLTSDSSSNSFNFGVSHSLPLNGSISGGASRSDVSSEYSGGSYNATIDTFNAGAGFQPIRNLNLGVNTQYTDNLGGTLYQSIIAAGGVVPPSLLEYSTHSLGIDSHVNYVVPALHLTLGFTADRVEQTALGISIASNSFTEMVSYGSALLGGYFNATGGVTQTSVDVANSPSTQGFFETVTYTRRVQRWNLSGSLNYSRNAQSVLVGYTSSGYGYSAGIGRNIGTYSHWSVNASGSKATFNNVPGSGNFNQTYSTAMSLKRFSFSAAYSKADGTSILTPTGLAPVSVPLPIVTPGQLIMFGGKSYSLGAATTPIRGLTLSAGWSKANSNTLAESANSQNNTQQQYAMLQYKLRQLWITGGYLKLTQGFSIIGGPPTSGSSFFIGVSRWFKFF